jgi:hypothetical protein
LWMTVVQIIVIGDVISMPANRFTGIESCRGAGLYWFFAMTCFLKTWYWDMIDRRGEFLR